MTKPLTIDQLAKKILPAGHQVYDANFASWRKRHGHAGSGMIDRALAKAKALGFVAGKAKGFNTPDGNVVGSDSALTHPDGWQLKYSCSYGVTSWDNSFSMELKRGN